MRGIVRTLGGSFLRLELLKRVERILASKRVQKIRRETRAKGLRRPRTQVGDWANSSIFCELATIRKPGFSNHELPCNHRLAPRVYSSPKTCSELCSAMAFLCSNSTSEQAPISLLEFFVSSCKAPEQYSLFSSTHVYVDPSIKIQRSGELDMELLLVFFSATSHIDSSTPCRDPSRFTSQGCLSIQGEKNILWARSD